MNEDSDELTCLGSSIDEIFNGLGMFDRENQAPPVTPSESHTVLFCLPFSENPAELVLPSHGTDAWDDDHVRLPCSPSSIYTEIDEGGNKTEKKRWDLIVQSLNGTPITDSRELEKAIKKYNTKFADSWKFKALHQLFEDTFSEEDSACFFDEVLPQMIKLALKLPQLIKSPIPLLKKKFNHSISLTQIQAGCLLANAFFCTFPKRNFGRSQDDYPEINFNRLFNSEGDHVGEKIKCILNYFRKIGQKTNDGVVTFQRRYVDPLAFPKWEESEKKFSSVLLLASASGTIEDATCMLQVDFANKYLGGGVLGWGCVQEEIRFVINPEMIVGKLFCESMRSEEAIVMIGCEQYNKYKGYSRTFKWSGGYQDETPADSYKRKMIYVVAMDATLFHKPHLQFEEMLLKRELNKAFSGFFHDPDDPLSPVPVSSGNWGCGAFRGHKPLKALIQLMACCVNRRNLLYYTFGEMDLMNDIHAMHEFLRHNEVTVGQLWRLLNEFRLNKLTDEPDQLYSFIYKQFEQLKETKKENIEQELENDPELELRTSKSASHEHMGEKELLDSENPPSKRAKTNLDVSSIVIGEDDLKEVIVDSNCIVDSSEAIKEKFNNVVLEIGDQQQEVKVTEETSKNLGLDDNEKPMENPSTEVTSHITESLTSETTKPSTTKPAKITDF